MYFKVWHVALPLLLCLWACQRPQGKAPPDYAELRRNEPTSESFGIVYLYTDSAHLKAKLTAKHDLERYDHAKKENVHDMDRSFVLEFFNPLGIRQSKITGNRGLFYRQAGIAEAMGNVVVTNINGDKLESEKLRWLRDKDEIDTDAFVKITTKEEIIFGEGLVSNTSFTRYTIRKIRGTIAVKE